MSSADELAAGSGAITGPICTTASVQASSRLLAREGLSTGRVAYLDFTRGLILVLMVSSHALFLSRVDDASYLKSWCWLPRGWATTSFILLSGFSVGVVYSLAGCRGHRTGRLLRRAREIAVVMFLSNVVLLICKHVLAGELAPLASASWWLGLVTFQTEYSTSGVLVSTSLLLILLGLARELAVTTSFVLVVSVAAFNQLFLIYCFEPYRHLHLVDLLYGKGIGGFPIMPYLGIGLCGYALGNLWSRNRNYALALLGVLAAAHFAAGSLYPHASHAPGGLLFVTQSVARFAVLLCLSLAVLSQAGDFFLVEMLAALGRFALFAFVAHRIILQIVTWSVHVFELPLLPGQEYALLLGSTLALIYWLLLKRQSDPRLNRLLKSVYL